MASSSRKRRAPRAVRRAGLALAAVGLLGALASTGSTPGAPHSSMTGRRGVVRGAVVGRVASFRLPALHSLWPGERYTQQSTNWSGLVLTGSGFHGARASWTVPAVKASSEKLYSATWVGVDGVTSSKLIQTGTAQDTAGGYWPWWELLPNSAEAIPHPVRPGDHIDASVIETASGQWTISMTDTTAGWTWHSRSLRYSPPGLSAEWIEEAPTVGSTQSTPADFGTVRFSGTQVYGNFGSGTGWYGTSMTAKNEVELVDQSGKVLALPSAPTPQSASGQSFSDHYVSAPSVPRALSGLPQTTSVRLAWQAPSSDGGMAITGYQVRVFRSGVLVRTIEVTSTSTTVGGLSTGGQYAFSVAAHNLGGWTSPFSTRLAVMPTPPPVVRVSSPARSFQVTRQILARYSATDRLVKVASYDVRYEVRRYDQAGFGAWRYPSGWQHTSRDYESVFGAPGDEYCFSVRARTANGAISTWSAPHCSALPLGSASLGVRVASWSRHTSAGYYLGAYAETTRPGAELAIWNAHVRRIGLVVTKCPTCGDITVLVNNRAVATVSTHATTTVHKVLVFLPQFSYRTATVWLKFTGKGSRAIVEGLGLT